MFEPVIQANDSLVLNGHFEKALEFWVRGANPREISVEGETYEGNPIRVLTAGNLASVSQQFTTPVESGPSASYVLSFLCETRHTEPGRMLITDENENLLKEIELEPSSARDLEKHLARIASKKPLVFKPIEYNVPFDLPLQRLDKVRLTIVAPRNADPQDYHLKVVITGIELALHLEPLVLQALKLDEQQLLPGGLCYLCLGAVGEFAHRLEFVPQADSPWVYTKAALVSDDNPQGAIIATPGWGVDHPLDLPWSLQCPLIGNQDPYVFPMELVNQYTAAPYRIEVSLGHHRLVFSEVLEAAYFPVRELKQSVRLGVRVASWYTGQFLAGRTVTWAIEGQAVLDTTTTDDDGWAYIDHQSEVVGDFRLVASVASPYYASGVVTTTLDIRVLETDPWKDVLAVVEGNALPWPQKTGYPNRGSTYQLNVRLPEVLRGTELALRWEGDSAAQLGVQVSPELEEPVPVDAADLSWWLNSEDKLDGRFELHLSCSKLLLPSDRKQMSLARNLVRIGDVQEANKFPVVDEHESVLLRVQVVHVVTSGDGDPVINALVDWQTPEGTISTRTGRGGWASVLYKPTRAGELVVSARVRAHEDAASMERPFAVKALASSPWKGQVRILFDGTEADLAELGLLCWRGSSHTLRVEPTPGSSLLDQMVTLQWRGESPAIGLTVAGIGEPMKLEAKGLEWTFSSPVASSISSLFSLTLSSAVLNAPREMFGRLISTELMDELTVMLDQVSAVTASQTLFPCIGARHNMRYLPNALSPLVGLLANLWWQGTPADELGASVEPPIDDAQPLNDGGAGWALDFISSKVGDFTLALQLPALKRGIPANPMRLNHNKVTIEDWRESAVDAVIGQDEVWSWVKVVSAFTGQPVPQFAVEWRSSAGSTTQDSDESGWSGHAHAPTTPGESKVVAQVISPFDNYEAQHRLSVVTLERDPWLDVRVRFDGHDEHPFGRHTYFPRRNGSHAIEVLLPDDSPLRNQEVSMGLFGAGPTELGLLFEPALGVPRRPSAFGLGFSLHCADLKDGAFALRLGAERLSRLSPANAMSLGIGEQIWKILASGNVQQVLEWGQELVVQVEVVSSVTGQGIAGVVVTWQMADLRTETSVTNFYGVATARFAPQTPGAAVVTATVGGAVYKESVDLPYTLEEPRVISELYEPEDSRLPPNEQQAHAIAKVVSAHTGLPLAGVQVRWDFAGTALTPSVTDEEGLARLTFTYPADGDGVLSAVVRGGLGGWDMASLGYSGIVPMIESLTSPDTNIDLGKDATAEVRVVSRHDGRALAGVRVIWNYPELTLPATFTGPDGKSRVDFRPIETGLHELQATAVLGGSQSLEFEVFDPASRPKIVMIQKLHGQSVIGKEAHIQVRVANTASVPIRGEQVFWSFPNMELAASRTDDDGFAEVRFTLPAWGTVSASVRGGSSLSLRL